MNNMRLYFRCLNAENAIKEFNGFLPAILKENTAIKLCELQAGKQISDNSLVAKLQEHNVITLNNNKQYSKIPMLTNGLSNAIEKELKLKLKNTDFSGDKLVGKIANKVGEQWNNIGHVLLSQLLLGTLWFNMTYKLAGNTKHATAILVPDMDLNHIFLNGIYPLGGNSAVVYWQSNLLCHPDTVYDILNDKNVVDSLRKMNDKNEFIAIGNALISLGKLKMYKKRNDSNKMPIPYVSLPEVKKQLVQLISSELKEFAKIYNSVYPRLKEVASKFYSERNDAQKEVSEHSFMQMVYLVFSYCVVERWLSLDILPKPVVVKGKKKQQSSPTYSL